MPSKYKDVMKDLPKLRTFEDEEDPKAQEKINVVKAGISERSAIKLATAWNTLRDQKDQINAQLKAVTLNLEAYRQLLEDAYESEGVSLVQLSDGSPIRARPEPYSRVEDKEDFNKWCDSEGFNAQRTMAWARANAITKQRLLDGLPVPDGVKVYFKMNFVRS